MDDFDLSEWLMDELEKNNMTVLELSKRTGVSCMTIRYWLDGKRTPKLATLEEVLRHFGKKLKIVDV